MARLCQRSGQAIQVDFREVDFLDRLEPDVLADDLSRNQNDRRAIAVGFVESVDEMETSGAATAGAGCQIAGKVLAER